MKRTEEVFREILYQSIEKKNKVLTQIRLSKELKVSLSNVNLAVKQLEKMGAVSIKQRNFHVINAKKILYCWASARNVGKDIIYKTRIELPVHEIEKKMPADIVFGAYSSCRFKFKELPADYSEVYVYSDDLKEIKKRFPENNKVPNLFVLKSDSNIRNYGNTTTIAHTFVDLWNLKEWYAEEFIKFLEGKLNGLLE
jgi:DNA-binding transcriptional regulator YhcF (GntR family)